MHPSRARVAFLLLYGALLLWQIDRWFLTPHGIVSTWGSRASSRSVSAGSQSGVSQTFTMGADGLDGVWLRPVAGAGSTQGDLVVDLSLVEGERRVRLERVVVPAADAIRRSSLHVPFRQVRHSRGHTYQIDVRHVRAAAGPVIDLRVSRDDALPSGRLFADRREQWGDLVFETSSRRATLPYWVHEVLRPWPSWVSAWPAVLLACLAFNGALAWACARAVGLGEPAESRSSVATTTRPHRRAVTPAALAAVSLVTVCGVAVAGRPTGRFQALDLIAALPDARLETTWPTLHSGVSPQPVLFGDRAHRGLVAMPTTTIAWTVDVPSGAVLRLGAAMRADMWERESDGIQMSVAIEHAGGQTVAADLTLFPMGVPAHRALMPIEVPLQPWAGQRITIVLKTTPERWGNAVNDVPVWTDPRIEWPRHPGVGTARVVR